VTDRETIDDSVWEWMKQQIDSHRHRQNVEAAVNHV
jgi:hypothetical protein